MIEYFGGKCVHCGHNDPICLDFDHILDDGYRDKSGKGIIFYVKENPERFQLLCKNCNWKKEYTRRQNAIEIKEATGSDESSSAQPRFR